MDSLDESMEKLFSEDAKIAEMAFASRMAEGSKKEPEKDYIRRERNDKGTKRGQYHTRVQREYVRPAGNVGIGINFDQTAYDLVQTAIVEDSVAISLEGTTKRSYNSLRTALYRHVQEVTEKNAPVGERLKITKVGDILYVVCIPTVFLNACETAVDKLIKETVACCIPIANDVQKAIALQYLRASKKLGAFVTEVESGMLIVKKLTALNTSTGGVF